MAVLWMTRVWWKIEWVGVGIAMYVGECGLLAMRS
jgi:hypothetical protein